MLSPAQYAATTIAGEAADQPYEGKVAVGMVIANRVAIPYASDATVRGAVLHRWAFSEFWAGFTDGRYHEIAFDLDQADALAAADFAKFSAMAIWPDCTRAWADALLWQSGGKMSFTPGPAFAKLSKKTVLYYNPAIVAVPPAWATAANFDAVIFDEHFFHDGAQ